MLRRAWHCLGSRHRVQLIVTPDIVTQPNAGGCADVLICPANEGLSGTRLLPYFERGGAPVLAPPAPPPGGVMWGGMEAGDRMLYAGQVIDGQVHALGGAALREACEALPPRDGDGRRCAIGEAALTCAPGELGRHFRHIVHTATPAFRGDCHAGEQAAVGAWATALGSCYESSLELAARCCGEPGQDEFTLAIPLLGAGARGAPAREASEVAAGSVAAWLAGAAQTERQHRACTLQFAVQLEETAELLEHALSAALPRWHNRS